MLKKGEHIKGVPSELQVLLDQDEQAKTFFESLSKSYKQGYCDWLVLLNKNKPDKLELKKI